MGADNFSPDISQPVVINNVVFPNGKSSIPIDLSKSDVFICSPPSKDVQSAISSDDTYVQGNGSSPSGDLQPVVPTEVSCNTLPSDLHLVDSNNGSPSTDDIQIRITNRHPNNPQLVDSNKGNPSIDASQNQFKPIPIRITNRNPPRIQKKAIRRHKRYSKYQQVFHVNRANQYNRGLAFKNYVSNHVNKYRYIGRPPQQSMPEGPFQSGLCCHRPRTFAKDWLAHLAFVHAVCRRR